MSVVVVGAGHSGVETAAALRAMAYEDDITLVDASPLRPYERPPLTKAFLAGNAELDASPLRSPGFFVERNIELRLGCRVEHIDRANRRVALADGAELDYQHLVLATGGRPRPLPVPGAGLPGVHHAVTAEDATSVRRALDQAADVVVVGGGYIGLEVAAAATARGRRVRLVEVRERLLSRVASEPLASVVEAAHRDNGVDFHLGIGITEILGDDRVRGVRLDNGSMLPADLIVIGVGSAPHTALAAECGLVCDDGILVDESCRTSDPAIFAVGDVARARDGHGRGTRLESVHNAVTQGRIAAGAVVGAARRPADPPWFWSDQFDMHVKIAGLPGPSDDVVIRKHEADSAAVSVVHLSGERLTCIETVNMTKDFVQGRKLITTGARIDRAAVGDVEKQIAQCRWQKEQVT